MKKIFTNSVLRYFEILVLSIVVFFSGCAHLFSGKYQKVSFQPATPGAKVILPKDDLHKKNGVEKFNKEMIYYTVNVEKEGYKSMNYGFQLGKRSPTFAFAVIDLIVPLFGWFYGLPIDLASPKTRHFDKIQKIPALTAYDKRKPDEKFMVVNNTNIDTKGKDIIWHQYRGIKEYNSSLHKDMREVRKINRSKDKEDLKVDNTIFTDALNGSLKKMNFMDTTNSVFPDISNTVYINASIKKITIHDIQSWLKRHTKTGYSLAPNDLMSVELEIEWEILDYYKQKIYTMTTIQKSDLFTYNYTNNKYHLVDVFVKAMGDNLEYSLIKMRKELSEKSMLNISNTASKPAAQAAITLVKPHIADNSRMNDFMKSAVTIKVDEGHGSGAILSDDGYIITAYHVVVGSKNIDVVFNDGSTATAEVVRKNEDADLALIKVNKSGLQALPLSNEKDPEIGIDVWAIGTPKSIDLGQSVSKGVLSGLRNANNVTYLQTDVSINGGNSGGPLINKQGTILGIVTSKLVGTGTEGIGFAVSANEAISRLNISYK